MTLEATLPTRAPKRPRAAGTAIVWPRGIEDRYGISAVTRYRWERAGRLPARDVIVGGKPVGWKPETLERADRGEPTASAASPAA
jgi:hypothetical protein